MVLDPLLLAGKYEKPIIFIGATWLLSFTKLWVQPLHFYSQLPIALALFGYEAVKLYKEHKKRISVGNTESVCGASIEWTVVHIAFCALCGILGGTVGGLLGSGGGFILGPLLLEIGVIPQVQLCKISSS